LFYKSSTGILVLVRLVAMQHEMREEWSEALEVLDSIIEEDEANSSARKRKIAIAR
jgi:transcription elongation factor GreA-like protein